MNPLSNLFQDLRHARRSLAKSPGFALIAIGSLALGIGSAVAVFSLVNGILLASLPVPNPQDLRILQWSGRDARIRMASGEVKPEKPGAAEPAVAGESVRNVGDPFPYPVFSGVREQASPEADVFGYTPLASVAIRGESEAAAGRGLLVTDNFFSALQVAPAAGRFPEPAECVAGADPVVVIGYRLWQRQFAGNPDAIGKTLSLNTRPYTVIGVLPRGFVGEAPGQDTDFYVTLASQPALAEIWNPAASNLWWLRLMARIKPGVSGERLQAALDAALARASEGMLKEPRMAIAPGRGGPGQNRDGYAKPLMLLLGIVGIVILAACANLAGLSLARGAARRHEFAVRAAVGAGRWRLTRQSLAESLTIGLAGGAIGVGLALAGKDFLKRLLAADRGSLNYDTPLDGRVLAFALTATLAAAVVAGLLPAWRNSSVDPQSSLRQRGASASTRLRAGRALVVAQIALSLLLVAGAGVFVRTLINLVNIDAGFRTDNLLLFRLDPSTANYAMSRQVGYFASAVDAIAALPGVRGATVMELPMLAGGFFWEMDFSLPGRAAVPGPPLQAVRNSVGESFFDLMGIAIRQGRGFTAADGEDAPKAVVVNDTFARKYLAGGPALGVTITVYGQDWGIVGVCADAKYTDIKSEIPATIYFAARQANPRSAFIAARTAGPPLALVPAARRAIAAIDSFTPLSAITTQEAMRDGRLGPERLFAILCGALAALALLLSCVGIYGLMAYNVARRTNEIGVRMALGATARDVSRPILREAILLGISGCAVGLAAYLFAARLIAAQLYNVKPRDPATLIGGAVLLVFVAALAASLPARRAARIDPMAALRAE